VDILLLESLIPEAMAWLEARHSLQYRPQLINDERALRHCTDRVRAIVVPNQVVISTDFLDFAPQLEVVARLQIGTDNIDLESCRARGIKVLQARSANVRANAEFLVGSLILLYRQGLLSAMLSKVKAVHAASVAATSFDTALHAPLSPSTPQHSPQPTPPPTAHQTTTVPVGREINGSVIGLLGIGPAASALAGLLNGMGARVIGYDPALHHSSPLWQQMRVQPVSLLDMMSTADAVSVQMLYASRYKGFINERVLAACKQHQLWVSIARSALFDSTAMLEALQDGRIAAWLTDSADESQDAAMPLLRTLPNFYATQRIGSLTRESRQRASWYMAHRLHDVLSPNDATTTNSGMMGLPGDNSPSSWIDSDLLSPAARQAGVSSKL
jgi:phosphoglycerate dehydrogenase-like enzyme